MFSRFLVWHKLSERLPLCFNVTVFGHPGFPSEENPWQLFHGEVVSNSRTKPRSTYLFAKTQNNSPPSRKAWPASTGITSRGNIPHIPTRIVAGMEYSQASFFTKMFDKSGRNLHGSKPNQLESSATVGFAFRGMARWIFTIAVSETRTENQRKTRMDSPEIFAIIRACLWRHLTPHLNVRTLKVANYWCFCTEVEPTVQFVRPARRTKRSRIRRDYKLFNSTPIFTINISFTVYGYLAKLHVMLYSSKTGTSVIPSYFKLLISFQSKFELASQTTIRVN